MQVGGRALGPRSKSSQRRPCIWQDLLEQFCLVRADQNMVTLWVGPLQAETVGDMLQIVPAMGLGAPQKPSHRGCSLEPIGHVWPTPGEAAITGPQCFFEDFGAHEVEEPWGPGEAECEPLAMTPGDKTSKTGEANQSQSSTELQSQSRRIATGPTRKEWCRLSDIIVQEPGDCLQVKSAQLLDWIEEFEPHLEPGTLGHWVANRIPECLEADEQKTP